MQGKPILLLDLIEVFQIDLIDCKFLKLFQGIIPRAKYMHFVFTF